MAILEEGGRATACILSEASGHRSRENIVIAAGSGVIAPNTVLGRITSGDDAGKYKPSPVAAEDPNIGNQTATAIALYPCDATEDDQSIAGLVRDAEVNRHTLVFASSVTTDAHRAAKFTQLAAVGIIAR